MIEPEKRKAIFLLHQEGMGAREISRRLRLSRNTVRRIIRNAGVVPEVSRQDKIRIDEDLLRRLHRECEGYVERMHEKLVEEEGVEVCYSTLTRIVRDLGLGGRRKARCDRVPDEPGVEMQHDTSPYRIQIGGQRVGAIASLLYLRYSKRRYLEFYPSFDRFRMKCFFHEALGHWGYVAPTCIIDNTNLARLIGTGKNAVIVPEMVAFSSLYGFQFVCHEVGHANRKAGDERGFWTLETNFLPGRTFESWEDLNAQAFSWATDRMERRPVRPTGLVPAKAFEYERSHLLELPSYLPAPYRVHGRITDQYGYVAFDANYYWVPGTDRAEVRVLEYSKALEIYRRRELLHRYPLPPRGTRGERFSPEGEPQPRYGPARKRKPTAEEEKRLRALDDVVGAYLDFARPPAGAARHRFVRALFRLSQQITTPLFVRCLARAHRYGVRDAETVRRIVLLYLGEGLGTMPNATVDQDLEARESYQEGRLTDAPDFTPYERMFEQEDEENDDG